MGAELSDNIGEYSTDNLFKWIRESLHEPWNMDKKLIDETTYSNKPALINPDKQFWILSDSLWTDIPVMFTYAGCNVGMVNLADFQSSSWQTFERKWANLNSDELKEYEIFFTISVNETMGIFKNYKIPFGTSGKKILVSSDFSVVLYSKKLSWSCSAIIWFNIEGDTIIVKQVQWTKGGKDVLSKILWPEAMINMILTYAKSHWAINKVKILSFKNTAYYDNIKANNDQLAMLYNVPAKRIRFMWQQFNKDDNWDYVIDIGNIEDDVRLPKKTTLAQGNEMGIPGIITENHNAIINAKIAK